VRLLLIEDNDRLAAMVDEGLSREGYVVDRRATLADAGDALDAAPYDVVLLDLGLPDGDGRDFLRQRRRDGLRTPVLVLTARSGLDDRVAGLDSGADDYLVKPFEVAELAARCRALLRRPGATLATVLVVGDVEVDPANHTVRMVGRDIDLPPREFALLELLARRQGVVVSREQLEHSLYSLDADVSPNALEAAVSRLRRRLAAAGAQVRLRTLHGVGYALTNARGAGDA
jgi:DNA-binding response OmpR family regulator